MKVMLDTSVIVASMVRSHPRRLAAASWHGKIREKRIEGCVSTHTLAELYSVLTSLPLSPRIAPGQAARMIQVNVLSIMDTVPLGTRDYRRVIRDVSELDLPGGVIYDALTAHAAQKAGVDLLITLNPAHFTRVWPEGAGLIRTP